MREYKTDLSLRRHSKAFFICCNTIPHLHVLDGVDTTVIPSRETHKTHNLGMDEYQRKIHKLNHHLPIML